MSFFARAGPDDDRAGVACAFVKRLLFGDGACRAGRPDEALRVLRDRSASVAKTPDHVAVRAAPARCLGFGGAPCALIHGVAQNSVRLLKAIAPQGRFLATRSLAASAGRVAATSRSMAATTTVRIKSSLFCLVGARMARRSPGVIGSILIVSTPPNAA